MPRCLADRVAMAHLVVRSEARGDTRCGLALSVSHYALAPRGWQGHGPRSYAMSWVPPRPVRSHGLWTSSIIRLHRTAGVARE